MKHLSSRHPLAAIGVASIAALAFLLALAGTASAAANTRTIEFEETEKGSIYEYVDNAPKTIVKHGFPKEISTGDEIAFTHGLLESGKAAGQLHVHCVATLTSKQFDKAGFQCLGTFVFGKSSLVASIVIGSKGSTGAVIGGTGIYAGARGTFKSKEVKGPISPVTVTLYE